MFNHFIGRDEELRQLGLAELDDLFVVRNSPVHHIDEHFAGVFFRFFDGFCLQSGLSMCFEISEWNGFQCLLFAIVVFSFQGSLCFSNRSTSHFHVE